MPDKAIFNTDYWKVSLIRYSIFFQIISTMLKSMYSLLIDTFSKYQLSFFIGLHYGKRAICVENSGFDKGNHKKSKLMGSSTNHMDSRLSFNVGSKHN